MAVTYESTTSFGFNITIGLGKDNKEVNISAQDLNDIKTKGLHFALPADTQVQLGSLTDLIGWLNDQLKAAGVDFTIPVAASDDWPSAIKDIFDGILNTQVTVTNLTIDQDKQDADNQYPPLRLSLTVTGVAVDPTDTSKPKPIPIIGGLFSVIGGGISLDRNYTETNKQ